MNRQQVSKRLAKHYSERFSGNVWAHYDESRRAYCIRGESLPACHELADRYPNGWSLLDYIKPAKARELVKNIFQ